MRSFQYGEIGKRRWDSEILSLIAGIYKEAGKQELYLKQRPEELEKLNIARYEKYQTIIDNETRYEEFMMDDADICIVAFGISARVSKNAILAAREAGIKVGMIRPITLWPFPVAPIQKAAAHCKAFISAELNMGQMIEDVRLASACQRPVYLCNRVGGMILSPEDVLSKIKEIDGGVR